jgi:hypothetical protein
MHAESMSCAMPTMDEEKAADEKLTSLAEGGINEAAAAIAHPDAASNDNADEEAEQPAARTGKVAAAPAKRMAAGRSKSR